MPTKKSTKQMIRTLTRDELPLEARILMLRQASVEGGPDNDKLIAELLGAAASGSGASIYQAQIEEMEQKLQQLEQGPLRTATFLHMLDGSRIGPRASVILEDGSSAFVTVPDPNLVDTLRRGDTVLVDQQGRAVLFCDAREPRTGDLARYERLLDGDRVEVSVNDHERGIYGTSAELAGRLTTGDVEPGRMLIVCPRRRMAFGVLPVRDGLEHYAYLSREPVPAIGLDDIGAPARYIRETIERVQLELTAPGLRRKYGLHRSMMTVLVGPSGTGKSYSILALWRELYEVMSRVTGVPVAELPPRVMRLRMSQVLSHWLGDSDKNLDRFFREVEQLAAEPFVAPDGRAHVLPALCILEEIDGLARARGYEPVYDRILTTALQRLDTTRPELRDKLVLFVATTNVPEQVDPAFLRRVGGTIERFGRLRRDEFAGVLDKQLGDRPVAVSNGVGADGARRRLIAEVTAALYRPSHADDVQVELNFAGSTRWESKYARDFLTASVVDRAMQAACGTASLEEHRVETEVPGLTSERLLAALDQQIGGIVDSLHESNVTQYLDVPDGVRVASLRRPRKPSIRPVTLQTIN